MDTNYRPMDSAPHDAVILGYFHDGWPRIIWWNAYNSCWDTEIRYINPGQPTYWQPLPVSPI